MKLVSAFLFQPTIHSGIKFQTLLFSYIYFFLFTLKEEEKLDNLSSLFPNLNSIAKATFVYVFRWFFEIN